MLLLLEDLKDYKHYQYGTYIDEEDAIEVVKAMARMHAAHWNNDTEVSDDISNINPPGMG